MLGHDQHETALIDAVARSRPRHHGQHSALGEIMDGEPDLLEVVPGIAPAARADRADCTAGTSSPTNTPMIAMTTSSSIKVKARRIVPSRAKNRAAARLSEKNWSF